jgi:hypothetical protein
MVVVEGAHRAAIHTTKDLRSVTHVTDPEVQRESAADYRPVYSGLRGDVLKQHVSGLGGAGRF